MNKGMIAAVCGLAIALMALVRCTVAQTDAKWVGAQTTATTVATTGKQVTEAAGAFASARIGEKVDADIKAVRRAGADLRKRVRGHTGAAGSADLPGSAPAAGGVDDPASGAITVVADPDLRVKLIEVAEEGDVYRAQVLGWQAWWREVQAAWALGAEVGSKPPD